MSEDKARLDEMKRWLADEREKHQYSLDEPVEPIKNRNGIGRVFVSVVAAAFLIILLAVIISAVASVNAGRPFTLFPV